MNGEQLCGRQCPGEYAQYQPHCDVQKSCLGNDEQPWTLALSDAEHNALDESANVVAFHALVQ